MSASTQDMTLQDLRARVSGGVFVPGEQGYDAARFTWNLSVNQQPALAVVANNADDVAHAVRYANAHNMTIAVKTTGHGVISPADDCMLIVTSAMNQVQVNAPAKTAWVSGGAKWGDVLAQTVPHGLAPVLGSTPEVGAVGYTLGGGFGWLGRNYGMSCDNVNAFQIVTADGNIVRADATENSDLFWALRGGGSNFGIVTGMEIRLYPVANLYAGNLFYPVENARAIFARYREWIADAPQALTSSIVLMNFPPFPFVPEFVRGKSFVMVRGAFDGPTEQGEALLKFWRDWQTPLIDDFKSIPFAQIETVSNDPKDPLPCISSGGWLNDLSDETAETLIQYALPQGGPPLLVFAEVRHAGGAIKNMNADSTAYSHRAQEHLLSVIAAAPTPEIRAAVLAHIAAMKNALGAHLNDAVYMNFLEGQEARTRTPQGFTPEHYQRLVALKRKYDPQNRFNHSYVLTA